MSVRHYGDFFATPARLEAMRRAIRETVRPGDRVLDLGTGLGTYALMAAEAGAGEVVAVERDPIVHVAESAARVHPQGPRVNFVRGDLVDAPDLAGPFDLVLYEDFSGLGLDAERWRLLAEVRRRAGRGARTVPGRIRIAAVPVGGADLAARLVPDAARFERFGIDGSLLRTFLANEPLRTEVPEDRHLGAAGHGPWVAVLPPPSVDALRVEREWIVPEGGRVDAILVWLDLDIGGDVVSNGPSDERQPWGQYAFPIHPVLEIPPTGTVRVEIGPEALADGAPGLWKWRARVGRDERVGHALAGLPLGAHEIGR